MDTGLFAGHFQSAYTLQRSAAERTETGGDHAGSNGNNGNS